MDSSITEAFWHAEHYCYGRRLRPLTLRHCFVLATAGNPLIEGGIPTTADLVQFVEIVSRDSRFFLTGKRPNWFLRQWVGIRSVFDRRAVARVQAYIGDFCTGPQVWQKENAKGAKANWILSTVAGLAHWLHVPIEEAWEMSPGAANWLLAAGLEQAGQGIDIMSEAEQAAVEEVLRERRAAGDGN